MKASFYLFGSLFVLIGFSACVDEPEFADEPVITAIEDFYFVDNVAAADTLAIRIAFEDGDGDLGLTGREATSDRYGPFNLPLPTENGELIKYDPNRTDLPPFNCEDYTFPADLSNPIVDNDTIKDTVFVVRNPFVLNYEVIIFRRETGGEYKEFNLRRELCLSPLGGRFSPLKDDFSDDSPRVGTITFFAQSFGFKDLFRNDSIRLGVVIRDRALHESNMMVSEPFTLEGITRIDE